MGDDKDAPGEAIALGCGRAPGSEMGVPTGRTGMAALLRPAEGSEMGVATLGGVCIAFSFFKLSFLSES